MSETLADKILSPAKWFHSMVAWDMLTFGESTMENRRYYFKQVFDTEAPEDWDGTVADETSDNPLTSNDEE